MSASSSSGGSSEPPSPSPQNEAAYLAWHYNRYMVHHGPMPEMSGGWSWEPYIKALILEELKFPQKRRLFHGSPRGSDRTSNSDTDEEAPDDKTPSAKYEQEAKPPPNLPCNQAHGSWNYQLYVPAWTDPNLTSDTKPVYSRQPMKYDTMPPRDLFTRMRPALRAEDAALNPTALARRWGIYPGRSDGRSRMTPPCMGTTDYNKGINGSLLRRTKDKALRHMLQQETQARIQANTTAYRGDGVAPEILDQVRRARNIPGEEHLIQAAMASDLPFSRFVGNLPVGFDAGSYREMVKSILADEHYQRLVLGDYTMEELLRSGVYSMWDDHQSSMNHEPLHELFLKERWETSASKGAIKRWPRLVYEIEGQCNEWDVHNNDLLWSALQPALQLVTKVLKSGPPFWRALKDMRTRAAIPTELDPRPVEDRATPHLIRIRPLEEALADGAVQDWPMLYTLAEQGLDYEKAVDYILRKTLKLDIMGGYMFSGRCRDRFRYGETSSTWMDQDSTITINISAEILWPLLVPDYSSTEKLTNSFLVAAILLHELMHATSYALDILCSANHSLWIPDVTADMAFELKRWYDGNADPDTALNEPWYDSDVHAELGWAFEHNFFGAVINVISRGWRFLAPSVLLLPFILASPIWPSKTMDLKCHNVLADGRACRPGQAQEPIPIEYFAKFYTQAFWDDAVPTYGFRAFRRRNPDRTLLYSSPREKFQSVSLKKLYGNENRIFFLVVLKTLRQFGYRLLAHWLGMTLVGAVSHLKFESVSRWREDLANWERSDEWWRQATVDFDQAKASGESLWGVVYNLGRGAYDVWAANWRSGNPNDPCPAYDAWVQTAKGAFTKHFRKGGPFFTAVARLHDLALGAQGEMEFIVWEFLTLPRSAREAHYDRATDAPPNAIPVLLARMVQYRTPLQAAVAALNAMSSHDVFQGEPVQWSSRFQAVVKMLHHLDSLIRSHSERSEEENQSLRDDLRSVPSANWVEHQERLREVGMQEYQLLTPAIRATIDEFDRRLLDVRKRPEPQSPPSPPPPSPIQDAMDEVMDVIMTDGIDDDGTDDIL